VIMMARSHSGPTDQKLTKFSLDRDRIPRRPALNGMEVFHRSM
jgi:hypothetical protein